jgi:3-methyl-2-oxobutanoate hydroxymethyltransferase
MLGITNEFKPRFLRKYADLHSVITGAVGKYVDDIKAREFPNAEEKY